MQLPPGEGSGRGSQSRAKNGREAGLACALDKVGQILYLLSNRSSSPSPLPPAPRQDISHKTKKT